MTNEQLIEHDLREFLMAMLAINEINSSEKLLEHYGLDSMKMLMFVSFIEERFNVQVDVGDVTTKNFATINDVCLLVTRLLS